MSFWLIVFVRSVSNYGVLGLACATIGHAIGASSGLKECGEYNVLA